MGGFSRIGNDLPSAIGECMNRGSRHRGVALPSRNRYSTCGSSRACWIFHPVRGCTVLPLLMIAMKGRSETAALAALGGSRHAYRHRLYSRRRDCNQSGSGLPACPRAVEHAVVAYCRQFHRFSSLPSVEILFRRIARWIGSTVGWLDSVCSSPTAICSAETVLIASSTSREKGKLTPGCQHSFRSDFTERIAIKKQMARIHGVDFFLQVLIG